MNALNFIRRHLWKIVGVVFVIVLFAFYPREWRDYVVNSPDGLHRLEVYRPHWLMGVWCYYEKDMRSPAIVRLYRNSDNAYFGESPIIDLSMGESPIWLIDVNGVVSLGTQFEFTGIPKQK